MVQIIHLPPHVQSWLSRQVSEGRYPSAEAAITAAVEQAMESTYRWEEDEDLLSAISEADRDGDEEYTPELMKRLSEEARENAQLGKLVPYDLTY